MPEVSYDSRAVLVDGKRTLILSGAIHYPRSTPAMWAPMMKRSRDAGLNTIETYVFWNLHERRRGVYDFSDRLDLRRFVETAAEFGLHVILRIGPYICAETNYGGFPAWLRDVPGMRMRTFNEPFMREMSRWVRAVVDQMKGLFAPGGGPIILAQVENEYDLIRRNYGAEGDRYAQWAIDFGQSLELGIPWIMCVGGAPGAIETINGFYAHEVIDEHFEKHPDQPALWTENWPGWYDIWGRAHLHRPTADVAYAVCRFVAQGGTGVNYYMWHGGTNFGREAMYLQTTSYDYSAPLDEFGLETTKSKHLALLHRALNRYADVLLCSNPPEPVSLGEMQSSWRYGRGEASVTFLANDDPVSEVKVEFDGKTWTLGPESVTIVAGGKAVFNTAKVRTTSVVERKMEGACVSLAPFTTWAEPMPMNRSKEMPGCTVSRTPVEQLSLTRDESDYTWYTTTVTIAPDDAGRSELRLENVCDVVHVFVDGRFAAVSHTVPEERRDLASGEGYSQSFELNLASGRHELSILCSALGLIKGDWQLGDVNMVEERKGFWGTAYWRERPLRGAWVMEPGLVGEHARLYAGGSAAVKWHLVEKSDRGWPLRWYRTHFARPETDAPLALDLAGMNKGLAWLNGRCLGRYWLVAGLTGPLGWMQRCIRADALGRPTQRYYHLPTEWLTDANELVLFEEIGGNPSAIRICEWK